MTAFETFFVISRQIGDSPIEHKDWTQQWCSNPHHGKKYSTRARAEEGLIHYRKEYGAANIKYMVTEHEHAKY
jgi:hypothetical protein